MARPLPGAALRRPAPARRRRPRARRRPAADADGRAVRRDRPDQPRAPAERVPAPAGARSARRSCSSPTTSTRRSRWATGSRSCSEGGKLAQYAPPAELLMQPGQRRSSRTSSAPTARSSGSRCSACATSTCGRRRWCAWASRRPRRGAQGSTTADVPYPLLVDDERPPARLAVGARRWPGERVTRRAALADPSRSSSSTTCCATRSPTCSPTRRSTGRWSTSAGDVVGVLSIEMLAHALQRRPTRSRREPTRRDRPCSPRSRSTRAPDTCGRDNGFCPQLDRRQLRPLRRPVLPARRADGGLGRDRLRDRVLARRCSPTGGAG